jgi:hypothetical protein
MGQAKRRGTYEQRRQSAIAKANPHMGPAALNQEYKRRPSCERIDSRIMAGMVLALTGWDPRR